MLPSLAKDPLCPFGSERCMSIPILQSSVSKLPEVWASTSSPLKWAQSCLFLVMVARIKPSNLCGLSSGLIRPLQPPLPTVARGCWALKQIMLFSVLPFYFSRPWTPISGLVRSVDLSLKLFLNVYYICCFT